MGLVGGVGEEPLKGLRRGAVAAEEDHPEPGALAHSPKGALCQPGQWGM